MVKLKTSPCFGTPPSVQDLMCTKMSLPSAIVMKPKPFTALKLLQVPEDAMAEGGLQREGTGVGQGGSLQLELADRKSVV